MLAHVPVDEGCVSCPCLCVVSVPLCRVVCLFVCVTVRRAHQRCCHLAQWGNFPSLSLGGERGLRCYVTGGEQVGVEAHMGSAQAGPRKAACEELLTAGLMMMIGDHDLYDKTAAIRRSLS